MANVAHIAELRSQLQSLAPADENYAVDFVDRLLKAAEASRASDVHLQPTPDGLQLHVRIDGVLQDLGVHPAGVNSDVVTRLKVLADLLTYRYDVPQEGRVRKDRQSAAVETRVSTFPTLHGERAVVRLFGEQGTLLALDDLGLPDEIVDGLRRALLGTSGALLVAGPAGSGKTTTAYACLRELVRESQGGRSVVSLEDPIEVDVPGVAQSQTNEHAGFDFPTGLRSLMRQDPEVIMVGEIRDRVTAEVAFQAALTGQLVLTTFHAGSAAGAVGRLLDMGIEAYMIRSGLAAVVCQRLLRRLCRCAKKVDRADELLGLPVETACAAVGCDDCGGTGYRGRQVVAEMLVPDSAELRQAIADSADLSTLESVAEASGMTTCRRRALELVEAGLTTPHEVRRVLGLGTA